MVCGNILQSVERRVQLGITKLGGIETAAASEAAARGGDRHDAGIAVVHTEAAMHDVKAGTTKRKRCREALAKNELLRD